MVFGVGVYVPYQHSGLKKQRTIQDLLPKRFFFFTTFTFCSFFLQIFKGKGKVHLIACHEDTEGGIEV